MSQHVEVHGKIPMLELDGVEHAMPFRGLLKLGYPKYGYQTDMTNIWKIIWNRLCLRNFLFWDDPSPSSSSNKRLPTAINGSSLIVERSYGKPQCLNPAYHPTKLA